MGKSWSENSLPGVGCLSEIARVFELRSLRLEKYYFADHLAVLFTSLCKLEVLTMASRG